MHFNSFKKYLSVLLLVLAIGFVRPSIAIAEIFYSQSSGPFDVQARWNALPGGGSTSPIAGDFTSGLNDFVIQNGDIITSPAGASITINNLTVKIGGTFQADVAGRVHAFVGLVTVESGGNFTSTDGTHNYRGGINNSGFFSTGINSVHIFTTTPQSIDTSADMVMQGATTFNINVIFNESTNEVQIGAGSTVIISSGSMVTNSISNGFLNIRADNLQGPGSLLNDVNAHLKLWPTTIAGNIVATASGNTVEYFQNGPQDILNIAYHNLMLNSSGGVSSTKSFIGTTFNIAGDLDLTDTDVQGGSSTINLSGNLTGSGTSSVISAFPQLVMQGSSAQTINLTGFASFEVGELTIDNQTTIQSDMEVSSQGIHANSRLIIDNAILDVTNGDIDIDALISVNGGRLEKAGDANFSTSTSFGSSRMIIIQNDGFVRINDPTSADPVTYPIGTVTEYTPVTVTTTFTSGASPYVEVSVTALEEPNVLASGFSLTKYWTVNSSDLTISSATITMTYDDTEIVGDETKYLTAFYDSEWSIGAYTDVNAVGNTGTYSVGAVSQLNGNYTIGETAAFTNPFITTWLATSDNQITIPTTGGGYLYNVYWENKGNASDNGTLSNQSADAVITGLTDGATYRVEIAGDFPRIYFNDGGDKTKIRTIEQWGDIAWTSMASAFYGCINLTYNAADTPDLSLVSDASSMFRSCTNFNGDLSAWDMSNVTDMSFMFSQATTFNNGEASGASTNSLNWTMAVGVTTTLRQMFTGAIAFNQDINSWDVSMVNDMYRMFFMASSFNGDISSWNVGNVENMQRMFEATSFDKDIGGWVMSSVLTINQMFTSSPFNQNISGWNVSSVTSFNRMFEGASLFNNGESAGSSTNPLNWTMGTVTDLSLMFTGASSFNQDISSWDVSNVINMNSMLNSASFFDQSLASWNIESVTNMSNTLNNTGLSVANYDATLIGWATLDVGAGETLIPSSLTLGASGLYYCDAESARADLIGPHGWTISDEGSGCFIVTNTNDLGSGSLRWTIDNANANANADSNTISFDIAGSAPHTITPTSVLPVITSTVIIDGFTQPGWIFGDAINMVIIDGSTAGNGNGFNVQAPNVEIYGLVITGSTAVNEADATNGNGIYISGDANDGFIIGSSTKGNIINGNRNSGIEVTDADAGIIQGNRVGTAPDGLSAPNGNSGNGISLIGSDNTQIGGSISGNEGNLISGNNDGFGTEFGINIVNSNTVTVQGNFIGSDESGSGSLGNIRGLHVNGGSGTTIGGAADDHRNIIVAGTIVNQYAVYIQNGSTITVENNFIGVEFDGITAQGNLSDGIAYESDGTGNIIRGNTISGNSRDGIWVNTVISDLIIENNMIGTTSTGVAGTSLRNRMGIYMLNSTGINNSTQQLIVRNNIIGASTQEGISVSGGGTGGNTLIENNLIGLGSDGNSVANTGSGIEVLLDNVINLVIQDNTISANSIAGIYLDGTTGNHLIQNNKIGTNSSGVGASVGNLHGVLLNNAAGSDNTSNQIKILGNTVSGNGIASDNDGIQIGGNTSNIIVQSNKVGVESDGATPLGNVGAGINFASLTSPTNVLVGGVGFENIISNNGTEGIRFNTAPDASIQIDINSYSCNGSDGIGFNGAPPVTTPMVTSVATNVISGTSNEVDGAIIDVYEIDPACMDNQGATYVGQATVTTNSWSLSGTFDISEFYVATVTDITNGISEFSLIVPEIEVYQGSDNTGILLTDAGSNLDLGSTAQGTDLDVTFAIENIGSATLTIGSIIILGSEYSIISAPTSVARFATETFIIRLDDTNIGDFDSRTVTINSNDSDETSFTFDVSGSVVDQYIVTNTLDDGIGSLRWCLGNANTAVGANSITFSNAVDGGAISLLSPITIASGNGDGTSIDGDINGNNNPNITIEQGGTNHDGLIINASNCQVKMLHMQGFIGSSIAAIKIDGSTATGNHILGNRLGTTLAGNASGSANFTGVDIRNGAIGNFIGDGTSIGSNVIGVNTFGIRINDSNSTTISGNHIGIGLDGSSQVGNSIGVDVFNSDGTIIGIPDDFKNNISNNSSEGIRLISSLNTVIVNAYVGVDQTGLLDRGNGNGIRITDNSDDATIGGNAVGDRNIISGNSGSGIRIEGTSGVMVAGNYVGLGIDGDTSIGNGGTGVFLDGGNGNQIGNESGGTNVISSNGNFGIYDNDDDTRIHSNYIGTNAAGTLSRGNTLAGILAWGGSGLQIGGAVSGQKNVVSGNETGISVRDGVTILGNYIGTNAAGDAAIPNNDGIEIIGSGNTIGDGTTLGSNVISGNNEDGIYLRNEVDPVENNVIENNFIGLAANGIDPLKNELNGIYLGRRAKGNLISKNTIASNTENGIELAESSNVNQNIISQNAIFDNGNEGILITDGAQNGILPPTITNVSATTISGTGNDGDLVELFYNNTFPTPQGEVFLSQDIVSSGVWSMSGTFQISKSFTATVTDTNGNTSEFSAAVEVDPPGNALDFDGTGSLVDFGDVSYMDGLSAITIEAWFNTRFSPSFSASDEYYSILAKGEMSFSGNNAAGIYFRSTDGGGEIIAQVGTGGGTQIVTYPASNIIENEWYHIALGWTSGGNLNMYINGSLVALSDSILAGNINNITESLYLGSSDSGFENQFDGRLDEVRIWDSERSQVDIQNNMFNGLVGNESGLQAYYRFDQGVANDDNSSPAVDLLPDRSQNQNDGILSSFTLVGNESNWVNSDFGPSEISVYDGVDNSGIEIMDAQVSGIDFGNALLGNDIVKSFTIENTGASVLSVSSIVSTSTQYSILGAPTAVATGTTETFTITFDGSSVGSFTSTISIASTDADENLFTFQVSGEITKPEIAIYNGSDNTGISVVNGGSVDIGSAVQGNNLNHIFALLNEGTSDLTVNSIVTNDPEFLTTGVPFTISAGSSETFTVTLIGTNAGSFSTFVDIDNDDSDASPFSFGVTATITAPEINLFEGNDNTGAVITDAQVTNVDFGSAVHTNDITQTFAIENTGTSALSISSILASGSDFSITSSISTVATGATETFTITLSGATAGAFNSSITITNDDSDENPFTFPVTGTITAPEINLFEGTHNTGLAISDGQSSNIDFGSATQPNDITKVFAIENTGTSILSISGISVSGSDFSITSSVSAIASGTTETFTATLSGINDGVFNATISVTSDDQDETIFDFPITGTITASGTPEINVFVGSDNSGVPITDAQIIVIDFGTAVEEDNIVQTFAIENTGTSVLNIVSIGSSSTEFTLSSVPTAVAAGITEVFTINLDGALPSVFNSTITITSDDADENSFAFSVTGEITAPEMNLFIGSDNTGTAVTDAQTTLIDFGNAVEGNDIVQTFALENTGTSDLTISSISSSGTEYVIGTVPTIVTVGGTEVFTITLDGTTLGAFNSTITIANDDSDENPFTFSVTGEITASEIAVFLGSDNSGIPITDAQTTVVDFGSAVEGNNIVQTFAIENTGTSDLTISSISSSGTEYVIGTVPAIVTVGGTEVFTITLDGTTPGAFNSTITITNDDSDENPFTFDVTGTITTPEISIFLGSDNSGVAILAGQIGALDYGSAIVGNDIVQTFAIENRGTSILNISDVTSSSTNFTVNSAITSIATGVTENFEVALSGALEGTFNTIITVASDDMDEALFDFSITGTIAPLPVPEINLFLGSSNAGISITDDQQALIDLGSTILENDLIQTFSIENTGTQVLNVSDISVAGTDYSVTSSINTIAIGATESFNITLSGVDPGTFDTTVTILSDDSDEEEFTFTISGRVEGLNIIEGDDTSGDILISNEEVDLGTTPLSVDIEKTFVVKNLSTSRILEVKSIESDNPVFRVENINTSIASSEFIQFNVTLVALTPGNYAANISVSTSANDFVFMVTGEVLEGEIPKLNVFNALTPNGDGVHDFLKIGNIDFYPDNTIVIYNRWGDKVFELNGYDNVNNIFIGNANVGSAEDLQTGNYFYRIDKGEGYGKVSGYLFLKR
jgi:gliding motility-associated-like protein